MTTPQASTSDRGVDDRVSEEVRELVRERPWLVPVTRIGWIAKGAVYALMGVATVTIARGGPSESAEEEASPQGALDTIRDTAGGRLLLGALCLGLVLYVVWRVMSIAILRGNDLRTWLNRIGYAFSAIFYTTLAWLAGRAAFRGADPGQSTQVEDMSRTVLEWTAGRWLLGIAGAVVIVVGIVFVVDKGLMHRYRRELDLAGASETERKVLDVTGTIGWIGRGVVTALVGVFVLRAAWQFDASEAKGFDLALRDVADSSRGAWLVLAAGVGLIVYAVFCVVSSRRQALRG